MSCACPLLRLPTITNPRDGAGRDVAEQQIYQENRPPDRSKEEDEIG